MLDSIRDKTALVGVVGLGYVGLPLVRAFVEAGFRTIGFDVDEQKVDSLREGRSYIAHVDSDGLRRWTESGSFEATSDLARLHEADALLICVPTPLDENRDPDLTYVRRTAESIAATLRPGQVVVLESTTYPTTTREVVLPILETSGLACGRDFFLAYSPEREDPGNPDYTASGIPKIVGGIDATSSELAQALYEQAIVQVVPVSSPEVAEACKILENTYRAVNIALVNEMKVLYDRMGIDVWEVVQAASTKPFGFQPFYPGPGLGGHCIPIDPFYLTWIARRNGMHTRFIELAGEINSRMPGYVVDRLTYFLNEFGKPVRGSRICILGVAYKKDVDDPRESPAFALMDLLAERGAVLSYNDPHVPVLPSVRHREERRMESTPLDPEFLGEQDCVLISTNHSAYDYEFVVRHSQLVLDTRNATEHVTEHRDRIRKA